MLMTKARYEKNFQERRGGKGVYKFLSKSG